MIDKIIESLLNQREIASDKAPVIHRIETVFFIDDDIDEFHKRVTPKPNGVIFNGPATIVLWGDGTKTISKAHDGDEFDPVFGMAACTVRKITKNRGHGVDEWEPLIDFLASTVVSPDECRFIAKILNTLAVELEIDGVMERIEEFDAETDEECFTDDADTTETPQHIDADEIHAMHEKTWAEVRELIDRGEM